MSYNFNVIPKDIGTFYTRQGGIRVQVCFRQHLVRASNAGAPHELMMPEFMRFEGSSGGPPVDVPVDQLEGFLGLLGGAASELKHQRSMVLRDLERLGQKLSGGGNG